jgi:hypothetical protein
MRSRWFGFFRFPPELGERVVGEGGSDEASDRTAPLVLSLEYRRGNKSGKS